MDPKLKHPLNRRKFLGTAITGTALAASTLEVPATAAETDTVPRPLQTRKGDMLYRTFGKTGETVSVIGVGGSHIGQTPEDLAIRIIRTVIDRDITFMDNSWDYNNGTGADELKVGKALRDGYRQKVFLMTKVDGRTKDAAARPNA